MRSFNELAPSEMLLEMRATFSKERYSITHSGLPGVYDVSYFDNESPYIGVFEINKAKRMIVIERSQKDDDIFANTILFAKKIAKAQKYKLKYY